MQPSAVVCFNTALTSANLPVTVPPSLIDGRPGRTDAPSQTLFRGETKQYKTLGGRRRRRAGPESCQAVKRRPALLKTSRAVSARPISRRCASSACPSPCCLLPFAWPAPRRGLCVPTENLLCSASWIPAESTNVRRGQSVWRTTAEVSLPTLVHPSTLFVRCVRRCCVRTVRASNSGVVSGCNFDCFPTHGPGTCPKDKPPVQCLINPCDTRHCPPNTVCVPNYCGGCFARCKRRF